MKNENTKNTARNYDKTKFMTFKKNLNFIDKLQHHLRENRNESTSQAMQKILNQKMKISIDELLNLSTFLKKAFFFSFSFLKNISKHVDNQQQKRSNFWTKVKNQWIKHMSKSIFMDESKHVYCTETLKNVINMKNVEIITFINFDSKINLMNENVIHHLNLQMRLSSAIQMITQTSQEIQIIECCENVSMMIEDVVTYTAFMMIKYDDQNFILERSWQAECQYDCETETDDSMFSITYFVNDRWWMKFSFYVKTVMNTKYASNMWSDEEKLN